MAYVIDSDIVVFTWHRAYKDYLIFCYKHDIYVIYKALCFDVAQGRMNGAPNETRTHSCRSASLAC